MLYFKIKTAITSNWTAIFQQLFLEREYPRITVNYHKLAPPALFFAEHKCSRMTAMFVNYGTRMFVNDRECSWIINSYLYNTSVFLLYFFFISSLFLLCFFFVSSLFLLCFFFNYHSFSPYCRLIPTLCLILAPSTITPISLAISTIHTISPRHLRARSAGTFYHNVTIFLLLPTEEIFGKKYIRSIVEHDKNMVCCYQTLTVDRLRPFCGFFVPKFSCFWGWSPSPLSSSCEPLRGTLGRTHVGPHIGFPMWG